MVACNCRYCGTHIVDMDNEEVFVVYPADALKGSVGGYIYCRKQCFLDWINDNDMC